MRKGLLLHIGGDAQDEMVGGDSLKIEERGTGNGDADNGSQNPPQNTAAFIAGHQRVERQFDNGRISAGRCCEARRQRQRRCELPPARPNPIFKKTLKQRPRRIVEAEAGSLLTSGLDRLNAHGFDVASR